MRNGISNRGGVPRWRYLAAALGTVLLGLLWRSGKLPLSAPVAKYGGDALWAMMVFFGLRLLHPKENLWAAGATALLLAFTVEASQLLHAPWLDALRATRPGHLVLGSTFNWLDLPAYTLGVMMGVGLEWGLRRDGRGTS